MLSIYIQSQGPVLQPIQEIYLLITFVEAWAKTFIGFVRLVCNKIIYSKSEKTLTTNAP